ncbi:ATP-binding protein [Streptomyces palmae]|uniref:ATP-binding protein n=1 Tax=Streptomyces palmae TaxID=1701085 RepID=A0A4Z0HFD6_9ACTN|nr:ATP-binding protein [Streptomyces palmae]
MSQNITRTENSAQVSLQFSVLLSATRKAARLARLLSVEQIRGWGLPHEAAALVIGELAANAALHGRVPGRSFRLTLSTSTDGPTTTLRIEVADTRTERVPVVRSQDEEADGIARESGYGLLLVEELADRWGTFLGPLPRKTVWAELDLPA